ncbi:hypothetical protein CC77DRAFT_403554 [Alternaria alternata]|uniref:Uncharacterized protein n=1 Tax=Alternaria alternata TaxID=5599 RepID=A0A177DA42_ALTAL|nr:hypothetical protein CC77DRAFT_403554 [Alternaria alternata]OAG16396.1 hypothetical protein CC77DRAFT_403554 [Alternaria alternata]
MDVNADTDGLVRALLRLDEADRSNIVEHLPPRKVKNAFLLLLREIAGLPGTSDIATFGELANPTLLLIVLQEQPVAYAPLAMHPVPAQELVTTSNKRSISTAIADDSKRARIDATVAQNAKQSAAQVLVKEEEEIIEITSEAEDAEAETNVQSKAKDIREPADLKMYLRIPSLSGSDMWKDMDDLPSQVRAELERRFKKTWSSTEEKARKYAELTHDVAKYVTGGCCVYSLLVRGGPGPIDCSRGGRFQETANRRCIREHQPCAHFARFNNQYIICLVPLPERLRKGQRWTQMSYWIR